MVCEVHYLPNVQSQRSERQDETGQLSSNLGLLHEATSPQCQYLGLESNGCLKSRMRENRTYGSVRGVRQAFHKFILFERSVENAYSTRNRNIIIHKYDIKTESEEELCVLRL